MTRFARARGSKASNERAPEDSTPWKVMKEQLLQAKKNSDESKQREEAEQKRIENYENFLKDRKVQKRKATWCDFPESEQKKEKYISDNNEPPPTKPKNKNKKQKNKNINNTQNTSEDNQQNSNQQYLNNTETKIKKHKNKKDLTQSTLENKQQNSNQEHSNNKQPKIKKNKNETANAQTTSEINQQNSNQNHLNNEEPKPKKNKNKMENTQSTSENNQQNSNQKNLNNKEPKMKNNKKFTDGKPVRRKEIDDRSFQLIINGKEVELVRFDGFPVMKKDADRLQELKSSMIKKGIPKSEVQRTIKLERRRAEKALARVKRDVCYNCRKGGHVLSDCPELKSKIPGAEGADGVCFKCGSTEHRQFECKVQRDKEFRFATCFICKEPGHIARQCPDNPKGLYPNGGSCKLCGDVTHLRKDCPTVMDKREESMVKLQTLDSGDNIEDVGLTSNKITPTETSNKKPKKIKF